MTYTKHAAFATFITSALFADMASTTHPLGEHLRRVQVAQDLNFYARACQASPADRFQPFLDQQWFLKNKTSWFDAEHAPETPLPMGKDVVPYLTRVIVYDALAVMGASGEDVVEALGLWPRAPLNSAEHAQLGTSTDPGIDAQSLATALSALMLGSLCAVQQGLVFPAARHA